jgi:hypothetical protein
MVLSSKAAAKLVVGSCKMPAQLKADLQQMAHRYRRTLSQEIILACESHVKRSKKSAKKLARKSPRVRDDAAVGSEDLVSDALVDG